METKILELFQKFLNAAIEDSMDSHRFTCDVLNEFEADNAVKVNDLKYNEGIFSFKVNGVWHNLNISVAVDNSTDTT